VFVIIALPAKTHRIRRGGIHPARIYRIPIRHGIVPCANETCDGCLVYSNDISQRTDTMRHVVFGIWRNKLRPYEDNSMNMIGHNHIFVQCNRGEPI
jgi:hypothetical protein